MSLSSGPCLLDEVSSGAATCHMTPGSAFLREELRCCHVSHESGLCLPKRGAPVLPCLTSRGSAFLRGELRCCHVSHGPRRAVDHRNKEMPSRPRHAARLTCFQGLLRAFERHAAGGPLNTDETCGQAGCRNGPAQQTCSLVTAVCHSAE
jgi:hypothetical protein